MMMRKKYTKMMMIRVSTTLKVVSSSFLLTLTRKFATVECSLVQLSADIDFIYNDLTTNTEFSMSRFRLAVVKQQIQHRLYVLSPLQFRKIKKESFTQFLQDTLSDCPDMMIGTGEDPDRIYVLMPDKADVLVFMGLSLMLFRLSHGGLPEDGYRTNDQCEALFKSLKEMGKVDRLYRLDLKYSLNIIPKSLVLDNVKSFVGDGYVYNLISSILNLPIIDEDGNHRDDISLGGIPPVGEIARVLFNIVLMDIFDREFPKRFPGVAFTRMNNEVFILTRENDNVVFDYKAGYLLLEELSLVGNLTSIGPCDEPILCSDGWMVFLDSDRTIRVGYPNEFY